MTDQLPPPMVDAEVDLKSMPFTPLYRAPLFGSAFHARVSDAGWRAGVTLWLKSWDQSPAGSLPDDDIELCRLAELGRDLKTWKKIKEEAMWKWIRCNDGRLYHERVAEGVNNAWQSIQARRDRTEKARSAALSKKQSQGGVWSVAGSVARSVTGSNITEPNITESPYTPRKAGQSQSRRRFASEPTPIRSVVDRTFDQWKARLQSYARTGAWMDSFGPKPGEHGCEAPAAMVAELLGPTEPQAPAQEPPAAPAQAPGPAWSLHDRAPATKATTDDDLLDIPARFKGEPERLARANANGTAK